MGTIKKRVVTGQSHWRAGHPFQRGIGDFLDQEVFFILVGGHFIHGVVPLRMEVSWPEIYQDTRLLHCEVGHRVHPLYLRKRKSAVQKLISAAKGGH